MIKKLTDAMKVRIEWVLASTLKSVLDSDSVNLNRASQRNYSQETVEFIERCMPNVKSFANRIDLLQFSLRNARLDGLFCEFGVYKGESINFIATQIDRVVHGFDSFEGLPEFWTHEMGKGEFRVDKPPTVRKNVRLHQGWFSDNLPTFVREHKGPVSFLHIDADLYSSTKTVFDLLMDRIVAGTVIQFDEFFNYPGWQGGEYRAFQEFVQSAGVKFQYIGYTPFRQVAVVIT